MCVCVYIIIVIISRSSNLPYISCHIKWQSKLLVLCNWLILAYFIFYYWKKKCWLYILPAVCQIVNKVNTSSYLYKHILIPAELGYLLWL